MRLPCAYAIGTADGFCVSMAYFSSNANYCGEDVSLFCDRWSNIDALGIAVGALLLLLSQILFVSVTRDNLHRSRRLRKLITPDSAEALERQTRRSRADSSGSLGPFEYDPVPTSAGPDRHRNASIGLRAYTSPLAHQPTEKSAVVA